jgi:hypothetical protein
VPAIPIVTPQLSSIEAAERWSGNHSFGQLSRIQPAEAIFTDLAGRQRNRVAVACAGANATPFLRNNTTILVNAIRLLASTKALFFAKS